MRVVPLVLGSILLFTQAVFAQIAERKDYTQDCSKAIQSIPMRFTQASSPDAHIWYLENAINKNLIGATTVLYYYTPAGREWRVTVTGSVVSASAGHIKIPFLPSQLNTNSLNGDFDYLCKVSDGANQVLAVTKGTLTLDEDISATAGAGSLPAVTNVLNWGLYSNYQATATAGPYRAGTNVTFSALADGSVYINAEESTQFVAVMNISITDLSNRVVTATNQAAVNSNTFNTSINTLNTNTVAPSGTNTLQAQITANSNNVAILLTNSVPPSGTNTLQIQITANSNNVAVLTTNSVPPSGTNTLQSQISTNTIDVTNHEARIVVLEENVVITSNTFTDIYVARTNILGAELSTNGSFTGDAGYWKLDTAYYATNRIYINALQTGYVTPSNAIVVTNGGSYLVRYQKGTTNGSVIVSFLGNVKTNTTQGIHQAIFPARNTATNLVFTLAGGSQGNWIDDVMIKKITNGNAYVAGDLLTGGKTLGLDIQGGMIGDTVTVGVVNSTTSSATFSGFQHWTDPQSPSTTTKVATVEYSDAEVNFIYTIQQNQTNLSDLFASASGTNIFVSTNDARVVRLIQLAQMSNAWVDASGHWSIGTNVADVILHVQEDATAGIALKLGNRLGLARYLVSAGATNSAYSQYTHSGGGGPWSAGSDGSGLYRIMPGNDLSASGITGLTVLANGNFGFGNTNPVHRVDVTGAVKAVTGIFDVVELGGTNVGQRVEGVSASASTNATNIASLQTTTNMPVHIYGSDGMVKSSTNDWYAAYVSNAVPGDIVEIAPATYSIGNTYSITGRHNVTLCSAIPGRKVVLSRSISGIVWELPLTNFCRFSDIEFRYPQDTGQSGWLFKGCTGEFVNCILAPQGVTTYITLDADANTTNTLIFRGTRVVGDTDIESGAELNGQFYASSYSGTSPATNWTTKTYYVDINSNNAEKATDQAYRNPAGTIITNNATNVTLSLVTGSTVGDPILTNAPVTLARHLNDLATHTNSTGSVAHPGMVTNGANTTARLTLNGTNYLITGEAATASGTNVFAFLAQTNDMVYSATNSYQHLTNFVVVATQNVSVTGSNITVLADGYYRLGFDISAKQVSVTDQNYVFTLFANNAAEDEISAMNQLDDKEGQLNAQGIMLLSSGAVIDVRHWVNSEESLTVRRASIHVKSMAAGGETLAVDSTAGTNAQARVSILETNTASLAQGVAATNAQWLATNQWLTLAASDTVAFTNRGTNTYMMGRLMRAADISSFSGNANSATISVDIATFFVTNDLETAPPTIIATNILLTRAGTNFAYAYPIPSNRLVAAMVTNIVGASDSWNVSVEATSH